MSDTIQPPPRSSSEHSLEQQLNQLVQADSVGPGAFLLVVEGPQAGRLHVVGRQTTIGRGIEADIRINDPSASQVHARLRAIPEGFEIEDLNSRNGTRVNGEWIKSVVLHHKDAIVLGGTNLLFLSGAQEQAETQVISQSGRALGPVRNSGAQGLAVVHDSNAMMPTGMAYASNYPALVNEEEQGNGLADFVRSALQLLRLVKRYAWVLFPLPIVAGLVGGTSFYWLPGLQKAEATVRLLHFEKGSEQAPAWQAAPREVFFVDPILNFAQVPLVEQTLEDIHVKGMVNPKKVAEGLTVESTGKETYEVAFSQDISSAVFQPEVFLEKHLANYLHAEVDKAITTLTKQAEFLGGQVTAAEKELKEVAAEEVVYRRTNAEITPNAQDGIIEGRQDLIAETRRLDTQLDSLRQQLANATEKLDSPRRWIRAGLEDVAPLKALITRKKDQLSEALASGKTEDHHEVKRLREEIRELESQVNERLNTPLSDNELHNHPQYLELQRQADKLQGEIKVAEKERNRVSGQLGQDQQKIGQMGEVQLTLAEMEARRKRLEGIYNEVFVQYRERLKQIDLEKASVESRYQIINEPKQVNMRDSKYLLKRIGLGFVAGLMVALLIVAILEAKLYLKRHPELTAA